MLYLLRVVFAAMLAATLFACGGGGTATAPPLVDGSHAVAPGIASHVLGAQRAPREALAASALVDATNLMDWAEQAYPQYFPSHQQNQVYAPYIYRHYPETGAYLGVDGQYVRVLGPQFGLNILTVGVLSQFVCNVFPENCAPPTASAGAAQEVLVGSVATLHGSGSDANGLPITYSWTLIGKPLGSAAVLSAANVAEPTFRADVAGDYQASLVVSNGTKQSIGAFVRVTARAAATNVAPTANAGGSRSVVAGSAVFLSGSASSDGNGDPLTFVWTLAKPSGSGAVLANANTVSPYFTPDLAGTYVATLVVNDGKVNSSPATVSVTATSSSTYCCRRCTTGKPCGDTCISRTSTCRTSGGCACY